MKGTKTRIASTIAVFSFIGLVIFCSQEDRLERIERWCRGITIENVFNGANRMTAYASAIRLHGRVVDQNGDPVPGAEVKISLDSEPWKAVEQEKSLGDKGGFLIKGGRGAFLNIRVSKKGYRSGEAASVGVTYTIGGSGKRYRDPATPLVLRLVKLGPVEPLFYMKSTRWKLPLDGTVRRISLDSPTGGGPHQIEFRLTSDAAVRDEKGRDFYAPFDWSMEMKVPGGGFVGNNNPYAFEAPATGYKESVRYDFPASPPGGQWQRSVNGSYFVRFADDSYARIILEINGESRLEMGSWINLKPGSRHLSSYEHDGSQFHPTDPEK